MILVCFILFQSRHFCVFFSTPIVVCNVLQEHRLDEQRRQFPNSERADRRGRLSHSSFFRLRSLRMTSWKLVVSQFFLKPCYKFLKKVGLTDTVKNISAVDITTNNPSTSGPPNTLGSTLLTLVWKPGSWFLLMDSGIFAGDKQLRIVLLLLLLFYFIFFKGSNHQRQSRFEGSFGPGTGCWQARSCLKRIQDSPVSGGSGRQPQNEIIVWTYVYEICTLQICGVSWVYPWIYLLFAVCNHIIWLFFFLIAIVDRYGSCGAFLWNLWGSHSVRSHPRWLGCGCARQMSQEKYWQTGWLTSDLGLLLRIDCITFESTGRSQMLSNRSMMQCRSR